MLSRQMGSSSSYSTELSINCSALSTPAFHSSSGDTTQNAVEVWGYDAPYLQSVTSPESFCESERLISA